MAYHILNETLLMKIKMNINGYFHFPESGVAVSPSLYSNVKGWGEFTTVEGTENCNIIRIIKHSKS